MSVFIDIQSFQFYFAVCCFSIFFSVRSFDPETSYWYKVYIIWYNRDVFIHPLIHWLFIYWGLKWNLNIWSHIMTVPACSSGTLTIVLQHWNVMLQTQGMPPHLVKFYRHFLLMWNFKLKATTTNFYVLGLTKLRNPSLTFHTVSKLFTSMLS